MDAQLHQRLNQGRGDFVSNRVVTSKYNIITFLPIFLFEMFSRVAYLYFLLQVGTAVQLVVVLAAVCWWGWRGWSGQVCWSTGECVGGDAPLSHVMWLHTQERPLPTRLALAHAWAACTVCRRGYLGGASCRPSAATAPPRRCCLC